MKVVLFCGGEGTRMREYSDSIPKPMIKVGSRPILWHLMRYYAHFGHNDFILCLGYKAEVIKEYFLNYQEWVSNDFVLTEAGNRVELFNSDIDDWRISFVDTGLRSSVGERLKAVEHLLEGDDYFLANYADGLTDLDLGSYVQACRANGKTANFLAVRPAQSFHVVETGDGGVVERIEPVAQSETWINGGFFVFSSDIFSYIGPGEDLVGRPFDRLIEERQLAGHQYRGFWRSMDTFKDRQVLEDGYREGRAPWQVWKQPPGAAGT